MVQEQSTYPQVRFLAMSNMRYITKTWQLTKSTLSNTVITKYTYFIPKGGIRANFNHACRQPAIRHLVNTSLLLGTGERKYRDKQDVILSTNELNLMEIEL